MPNAKFGKNWLSCVKEVDDKGPRMTHDDQKYQFYRYAKHACGVISIIIHFH